MGAPELYLLSAGWFCYFGATDQQVGAMTLTPVRNAMMG
jgi:hypothetical protein